MAPGLIHLEMGITAELYEFIVRVVEDKIREIRVTREEFDKREKQ